MSHDDQYELNRLYGYVDQNPISHIDPFGLYKGEVTNGSAWSGFNLGGASVFPSSKNNAIGAERRKCTAQKLINTCFILYHQKEVLEHW